MMRNYVVIEAKDGQVVEYTENGVTRSFPASEKNSHYAEYLRYTAWVEAGNTPEDFWTRDLDSPEGLEQTQVTEEEKEETPQETEGEV